MAVNAVWDAIRPDGGRFVCLCVCVMDRQSLLARVVWLRKSY